MLNPVTISNAIDKLITDTSNPDISVAQAKAEFVQQLSQAMIDAIKSITITILPGTIIVAGSPTTQTNPAPIIIQNGVT